MKKSRTSSQLDVDFLEISGTCPALAWIEGLEKRSKMAKVSVTRYIRRVAEIMLQSKDGCMPTNLPPYIKPLKKGGGVYEIKVGDSIYRVYFGVDGGRLILILGGDKGGQKHPDGSGDADKAINYWRMFRDENERVVRRLRS